MNEDLAALLDPADHPVSLVRWAGVEVAGRRRVVRVEVDRRPDGAALFSVRAYYGEYEVPGRLSAVMARALADRSRGSWTGESRVSLNEAMAAMRWAAAGLDE